LHSEFIYYIVTIVSAPKDKTEMGKLFKAYANLSADFKAELGETKDKFISDLERGEICVYGEYELEGISSGISIYSDKIVEGEMLITVEGNMCHVVLSGKVEQEFDPEYFQDFIDFLKSDSLNVCTEYLNDSDLNEYPIIGSQPTVIGILSA
jgi:hypothetical protein